MQSTQILQVISDGGVEWRMSVHKMVNNYFNSTITRTRLQPSRQFSLDDNAIQGVACHYEMSSDMRKAMLLFSEVDKQSTLMAPGPQTNGNLASW